MVKDRICDPSHLDQPIGAGEDITKAHFRGGSAIGQEKRCGVTPHIARNDVIWADEMTSFDLTKRHSRVPK